MPLTNYPQGLASFGFPVVGGFPYPSLGGVFFVKSTTGVNSPANGTEPSRPYASVGYALTRCVAGRGDVIFVLPGHTESITAAAGWDLVSTVSVIGLGAGSSRPTITFTTVNTANIQVDAAGVVFHNLIFDLTGVAALAAGFAVTAADFQMINCKVVMTSSTNQAVLGVSLAAGADNARFVSCEFWALNSGATAAIQGVVAGNGLYVRDCYFNGNWTAAIRNTTVAWTNAFVDRNHFYLLGTGKSLIVDAATTGIVRDNVSFITANIAAGGSMTAAGMFKSGNLAQEAAGVASSAVTDPAAVAIT